jgi:hypothetical protein
MLVEVAEASLDFALRKGPITPTRELGCYHSDLETVTSCCFVSNWILVESVGLGMSAPGTVIEVKIQEQDWSSKVGDVLMKAGPA